MIISKKNILFISTIHRMSERILPALFDYHQRHGDIFILNLGQSSKNTKYSSNLRYLKKLDEFDQNKIYHGNGISNKRDVRDQKFCKESISLISTLCQKHNVRNIVLDDSRINKFNLFLGDFCKNNGIMLFANAHGNTDQIYLDETYALSKPFYNKLFVFGNREVIDFKKFSNDSFLPGGIPENDTIQKYSKSEQQITIIVNRVNVEGQPNERLFDSTTINEMNLGKLQETYNLPVVFKLKNRMSEDLNMDVALLKKSIPSNINFKIVTDVDDEIEFLSKSKIILTYGSTMVFKSLQLMIPTIVFKELGQVGLFSSYKGTVSLGENYFSIIEKLNEDYLKFFLQSVLEGSTTFNATCLYSDLLKNNIQ